MNAPRIENGDRAITVNKSFALTFLAAIVSMVFWVGTVSSSLSTRVEAVEAQIALIRSETEAARTRLRTIETSSVRVETKLEGFGASLDRIERALEAPSQTLP